MQVNSPRVYGTKPDPYEIALRGNLGQSRSVRQLKPLVPEIPLATSFEESQSLSRRVSTTEFHPEELILSPEDQPRCKTDRSHTLNIFKHKSQQMKRISYLVSCNKKRGNDTIKPTDSLKTVRAVVEMRKNEYEQKQKRSLKGSMYVNDLWGFGYEKDVLNNAMLRRQLAKQKSTIKPTSPGSQFRPLDFAKNDKPVPPAIPLENYAAATMSNHQKYYMANFGLFDSPKTENSDYYSSINTAWMGETETPRKTFRIRTEQSPPYSTKTPNKSSTVATSPKFSTPRSDYVWTPSSAGLRKKKYTAKTSMSDEEEPDQFKKSRQPSRDIIALDTKMFLGQKNQQFNVLMGDCETELQEKQNWNFMMNNLEELFVNAKYDKKKKNEVNKQAELKDNFKFFFAKKGRRENGGGNGKN